MSLSEELKANILRYYYVEKWRIGTIASQLHVHHTTVRRVLAQEAGVDKAKVTPVSSIITPYEGFIDEQLKQYPDLTAKRLYDMVCERGYQGGEDYFRHLIALRRPKKAAEAYLRLRTLPGEVAQSDWALFGKITMGRAERLLSAFVMVLSYSRKIFLRFYLNQRMSNFLDGHVAAFHAFGGVPRAVWVDNLKCAVLERQGDAIRFNPEFLAFAAHYRFEPRPMAIARGNEKGRVEKGIRYIRDNFFAGRQWTDMDDLNRQAEQWCNEGPAANRPCPEDKTVSVKAMFDKEQPYLLALPDNPYLTAEYVEVKVGKTPYVRFDLNDYSLPHNYVHQRVTVSATQTEVKIFDGMTPIACHPRSYDKDQQMEDEAHIEALVQMKRKARKHRNQDKLIRAIPIAEAFLTQAAAKGYSLRTLNTDLLTLLQDYGAAELEIALQACLDKDVPHPNAVRTQLQKRQQQQQKLPPLGVNLPRDERVQHQVIKTPTLGDYDPLTDKEDK